MQKIGLSYLLTTTFFLLTLVIFLPRLIKLQCSRIFSFFNNSVLGCRLHNLHLQRFSSIQHLIKKAPIILFFWSSLIFANPGDDILFVSDGAVIWTENGKIQTNLSESTDNVYISKDAIVFAIGNGHDSIKKPDKKFSTVNYKKKVVKKSGKELKTVIIAKRSNPSQMIFRIPQNSQQYHLLQTYNLDCIILQESNRIKKNDKSYFIEINNINTGYSTTQKSNHFSKNTGVKTKIDFLTPSKLRPPPFYFI